ncbi:MAG: ABC transporter ATP-binding protein [Treponema sp.]|uniref:ABC transporter ATP-binding protein n=1 Tax=Treponema sp. TaxID=166 RepID=UPI00298D6E80|nr:ABC transporter ATP-binding protein [Treponema sp.]MCQ2601120.1 ABC transporter ATP-binding protein [Treponema sp.]
MEPKIKIEHLGKNFFSRRQTIKALDDVNMEFAPGEFVSIVGPSGCGKSTIIRMIDDLIKPTSGTITIDGFTYDNKKEIPQSFIKKLGFVFQLPNLYPWLTVRQNLYLPLKVYGMMDSEHVHHVEDLLEMTNLTEVGNIYPNQISGGTAQRIGVIRGMVHKPEMLMMDEPFGALDDETREKLNMEMLNIWKQTGMTIIFITHNVSEAVLMSQRVYVMQANPGHVKAEVKIEFDEERSLELQHTKKFINYCNQIEELIGKVDLNDVV